MKLTGSQFGAIQDALLDAFDRDALRQMVRIELDADLDEIVGPGNLRAIIADLIHWAEQTDRVAALLDGACAARPTNAALGRVRERAQAERWFEGGVSAQPAATDRPPAAPTQTVYGDEVHGDKVMGDKIVARDDAASQPPVASGGGIHIGKIEATNVSMGDQYITITQTGDQSVISGSDLSVSGDVSTSPATLSHTARLKIKALHERLAALVAQYEAANRQLNTTLSEVDAVKIRGQIAGIEREMADIEHEMAGVEAKLRLVREDIRLDVAAPSTVTLDEPFQIAVAVMQIGSPPLAIDGLPVVSRAGHIFRSEPDQIVTYRVEIEAPDFEMEKRSYLFRLEPGQDSEPVLFLARAKRVGKLLILAKAYQVGADETIAAQTRVSVTVTVDSSQPANGSGARTILVDVDAPAPALAVDPDLAEAVQRGELAPFVGAGLSVGAGLPGWYDLVAELAQRSGQTMPPREWATGDVLIGIAQAYVNEQGLQSLMRLLKERLDTTGRSPTAAHRALAGLGVNLVFTANYDDLLERAFRDAGRRVTRIVRDGDIPYMNRGPGVVNLVKLYGDLDQPDTLVLAREGYERFFQERPEMIKLLEVELARSTLLYLGWSHSDPHFNLVFGQMLNRFGANLRGGFAVLFDAPDAQKEELRRKHVRLVDLPPAADRTAQLAAWLTGLHTP